jgi:hypothetical protein
LIENKLEYGIILYMKEKVMKGKIFVFVLTFLFGFSACELPSEKGFVFDENTFNSEWNKWKNNDIKNYSFTLTGKLPYWNFSRAIPLYKYEVNITVKNGIMDTFEYIGDVPYEDRDGNTIFEPEFTSISDMYQKISDRAKYEKEWWENNTGGGIISTKFEIKYDKQLNYITVFEPVSEWKSDYIVDTTAHAVNITNFTILSVE